RTERRRRQRNLQRRQSHRRRRDQSHHRRAQRDGRTVQFLRRASGRHRGDQHGGQPALHAGYRQPDLRPRMQPTLALPIPQPALAAGAPAPLEQPLDVTLAEIRYSDGVPLDQNTATKSGLFVYRTLAAGASEDVWNDDAKSWQPAPSDLSAMTPLPFTYKAGDPAPWRAVVIAAGQGDAAGPKPPPQGAPARVPPFRAPPLAAGPRARRATTALFPPRPP